MSYSSAIFYLDYDNGDDAARSTLTGVVFSNPSGTTVLGTYIGHGLVTGAIIDVTGCTQAYANSAWKITYVSDDTFTLDDALWASFTGADVTGNAVPRGGQSWTDAWKTPKTGATNARIQPGDVIRIAKSPAPTSLGVTGQLTRDTSVGSHASESTFFSNFTSTNTTPIVCTKASHGLIDGDIIKISGHATNTNANSVWIVANVTEDTFELEGSIGNGVGSSSGSVYRITTRGCVLSSAITKSIETCETNWTAGANVTSANASASYSPKQGNYQVTIITAAGHSGAGIIAKQALPASLDLSGYKQICFWFKTVTTALASGDLLLKLYSDTDCASEVESLTIPAITVTGTGYWHPIVINKGSALSSTVQGIAIYATKALASKTYIMDNFFAAKDASADDSLTLRSLISTDSSDQVSFVDGWYAIQSIVDRLIMFDSKPTNAVGNSKGYFNTSNASASLYKRDPTFVTWNTFSVSDLIANEAGTAGNYIEYSGGWNTSTDLQDGETIFDATIAHSTHNGFYVNFAYVKIDHIGVVRGGNGIYYGPSGDYGYIGVIPIASYCYYYGVQINTCDGFNIETIYDCMGSDRYGLFITTATDCIVDKIYRANGTTGSYSGIGLHSFGGRINEIFQASHNEQSGVILASSATYRESEIQKIHEASYNDISGLTFSGYGRVGYLKAEYNDEYGLVAQSAASPESRFYNIETNGNASGGINMAYGYNKYFYNVVNNEATKVTVPATQPQMQFFGKWQGDPNINKIYFLGGIAETQESVTQSGSGYAWQIAFSDESSNANNPFAIEIARILCAADSLVTVKCYVKKSHATNVAAKLYADGMQLAGMTSLVYEDTKADDTDWEELSISFTPTEAGVVIIKMVAWVVSTSGTVYFDTMSITQA